MDRNRQASEETFRVERGLGIAETRECKMGLQEVEQILSDRVSSDHLGVSEFETGSPNERESKLTLFWILVIVALDVSGDCLELRFACSWELLVSGGYGVEQGKTLDNGSRNGNANASCECLAESTPGLAVG